MRDSILLYDGAYEAFITDKSIPTSIFAIPGARQCAIEFRSFSKQGGFTGVRCGYVVIPRELMGRDEVGNKVSVSALRKRRTGTKFNGAGYIVNEKKAGGISTVPPLLRGYYTPCNRNSVCRAFLF